MKKIILLPFLLFSINSKAEAENSFKPACQISENGTQERIYFVKSGDSQKIYTSKSSIINIKLKKDGNFNITATDSKGKVLRRELRNSEIATEIKMIIEGDIIVRCMSTEPSDLREEPKPQPAGSESKNPSGK